MPSSYPTVPPRRPRSVGRVSSRHVLLVLSSLLGSRAAAHAQEAVPQASQSIETTLRPSVPGVPDGPPRLPSDTGRLVPAYQDFSRYTTPGMCKIAAQRISAYAWLVPWKDTVPLAWNRNTLTPTGIAIAKRCMARFTVAATPGRELRNLHVLAIMTEQPTLAHDIVERRLSLSATRMDSGQVLLEAIQSYQPPAFYDGDAVYRLMARLDRLGPTVATLRFLAYGHIFGGAYATSDNARTRAAFDSIAVIFRAMSLTARNEWALDIRRDYYFMTQLWCFQRAHANDAWQAALLQRYTRLRSALASLRGGALLAAMPDLRGGEPASTQTLAMTMGSLRAFLPVVGLPAPALTTRQSFAFNARGVPESGKVSLLVPVNAFAGPSAYDTYAALRRLRAHFDTTRLDIILLAKTEGFDFSGVATPDREAESIRRYLLDYQHLSAKLLVDETPFTRRADGRRLDGKVPFQQAYPFAMTLVDRTGSRMWIATPLWPLWSDFLDRAIQDALTVPPPSSVHD